MVKNTDAPPIKTINDYLCTQPEHMALALEELRIFIHSLVPDAEEVISYQIPTIRYKGSALVGFAAYKNHCSFFVMRSPGFMTQFKEQLAAVKYAGATIHFQPDAPLPESLVRDIVLARMAENETKAANKLLKNKKNG